ncbi:MAG: hypothetical protein WKF96_16460 [Solirubrobacteraceae bacterium]
MWLFTTQGFFSAVQKRDEPGTLLVRSRVREDAERLVATVGNGTVIETPERDYRFRVELPAKAWAEYVAAAATDIDYPNFKSAVAAHQGPGRADAYGSVWAAMYALQQRGSQ